MASEDGPPVLTMTPFQVEQAAAFPEQAAFDDLWSASGTAIIGTHGSFMYESEIKDLFLSHHESLLAFYQRSARAGHAVVRAFWY